MPTLSIFITVYSLSSTLLSICIYLYSISQNFLSLYPYLSPSHALLIYLYFHLLSFNHLPISICNYIYHLATSSFHLYPSSPIYSSLYLNYLQTTCQPICLFQLPATFLSTCMYIRLAAGPDYWRSTCLNDVYFPLHE